jgi:hypothetical protein
MLISYSAFDPIAADNAFDPTAKLLADAVVNPEFGIIRKVLQSGMQRADSKF